MRDYINLAFQRQVDSRLDFDPSKDMTVALSPEYFEHPAIGFFNPTSRTNETFHMRVNFLEYAIWLPLTFSYALASDEIASSNAAGVTISGIGHKPHPGKLCHWDALFGEPDYLIHENQVVLRETVMYD